MLSFIIALGCWENMQTIKHQAVEVCICWFHECSLKDFPLFFLFSDWLKSNHLIDRIKREFFTYFRAIIVAS